MGLVTPVLFTTRVFVGRGNVPGCTSVHGVHITSVYTCVSRHGRYRGNECTSVSNRCIQGRPLTGALGSCSSYTVDEEEEDLWFESWRLVLRKKRSRKISFISDVCQRPRKQRQTG